MIYEQGLQLLPMVLLFLLLTIHWNDKTRRKDSTGMIQILQKGSRYNS